MDGIAIKVPGSGARSIAAPPKSQDDPVYRATMALREPGRLPALICAAWPQGRVCKAELKATYYNPYSRARLLAEISFEDIDAKPQMLSLKVFSTHEEALQVHAREMGKRLFSTPGPAVMLLEDINTVAWWLPNGQNLRKSRACFGRKKFARLLASLGFSNPVVGESMPRLLRYVPRRRALFRWTLGSGCSVYLKFYKRDCHQRAACNLVLLGDAADAFSFRFPRLLAYEERYGVVVMDEVPGKTLTRLLSAESQLELSGVGQALAELHAMPLQLSHRHLPENELKALEVAMAEVKRAMPVLAERIDKLLDALAHACPACPQPLTVHGNFFGDQILIADGRVGIVDWDDLTLGDPLHDVGRLVAHLIYLALCGQVKTRHVLPCLDTLLKAYARSSRRPLEQRRLRWHVASALLMRAKISALRELPAGWPAQISAAVAAAELVLEGGWLP